MSKTPIMIIEAKACYMNNDTQGPAVNKGPASNNE